MLHLVEPIGQHPHPVAARTQGLKHVQGSWDEGLLVGAVGQVMLPHLTWQAHRARRTTSLQRQFKPPATQGGFVHPAGPEFGPTMVVGCLVMSDPRGQIGHPQGTQVKVLEPLLQGQPGVGFEVPQRVVQVKEQRSKGHERCAFLTHHDAAANASAQRAKASIKRCMTQGWCRKYLAASVVAIGTEINPETAKSPCNPKWFFSHTMRRRPGVNVRFPRPSRDPSLSSNHENKRLPECQTTHTPPAAPAAVTAQATHHGWPVAIIKEGVTTNLTTATAAHAAYSKAKAASIACHSMV